jgi:pantothenate kinase
MSRVPAADGGDYPEIGLRGDVIAASFGKVAMQREDRGNLGPKFLLRYVAALLRHWEECFWLVVLAVLDSLPFKHGMGWLAELAAGRSASRSMSGNLVAGHFGTFHRAEDVALSLLRMVSNNIGHIACLHAQQHGLRQIVFGGSFIRDHPYTIATISSAVNFFGRGKVQALFLKHDGFVGAIGAHLSGLPLRGKCERMHGDGPGTSS